MKSWVGELTTEYLNYKIYVFVVSVQYIFMFQVPWLPEFSMGLHDYRNFNAIFRGRKAVSVHNMSYLLTVSVIVLKLYFSSDWWTQ